MNIPFVIKVLFLKKKFNRKKEIAIINIKIEKYTIIKDEEFSVTSTIESTR